jgi:hypothetical protein
MILNGTLTPVETSGDIKSRNFKILASKKAFEILSSGLYSHKIRAIVRELGTNAADAHIAADNPAPFEVTLPGKLHAYFEVKDFGTGLSEDAVLNLYTTYFDSNKTSSNAFTGCLGLGSKSPFSYTDSFTVESRFGGEKTTYTAFLGSDGIPAVSRVGSEPTDEPNGLTIRIPVEEGDFAEFHTEVRNVYQWFQTRPVVHGGFSGFAEYVTLFDGVGYRIGRQAAGDDSSGYRSFERGVVVMGNVAYPLDFHKVKGLGNWRDYGLVLFVNIGDVEIAASREALSYDERTVAYLESRGAELNEGITAHVEAHVGEAATLWEARGRLLKLKGLLKDLGIGETTWRGQQLTIGVDAGYVNVTDPADETVSKVREVSILQYERVHGRWSKALGGHPVKVHISETNSIRPDKPVWLADTKNWKQALAAVVPLGERVYVLDGLQPGSNFLERSGLDHAAQRVSQIPKDVIEREQSIRPKKLRVPRVPLYQFTYQTGDAGLTEQAKDWTRTTVTKQAVTYVLIERFSPIGRANNKSLKKILEALKALGAETDLYGIRVSDKDKIGPKWKSLDEYVTEVLKAKHKTIRDVVANHTYCTNAKTGIINYFSRNKKNTGILKTLPKRHKLRRAVEEILAGEKLPRKVSTTNDWLNVLLGLCPATDIQAGKVKAKAAVDALNAAYPLLELVEIYWYSDTACEKVQKVFDYIKLVDASNKG